jgi:hypothetical protein
MTCSDHKRNVRPLEILTGGSPRLLVIIAGFAKHRSMAQLIEDLVVMVDEHTEYFRSHLHLKQYEQSKISLDVLQRCFERSNDMSLSPLVFRARSYYIRSLFDSDKAKQGTSELGWFLSEKPMILALPILFTLSIDKKLIPIILNILKSFPPKTVEFMALIIALKHEIGETVVIAQEVFEVAKDIHNYIIYFQQ